MFEQGIAVIGISCRLPQARDVQTLWRNLLAGRVCSTHYSHAQLRNMGVSKALIGSKSYVPVDSRLLDADQFDPELFTISQREAELLDPQHRLLLECAWELAQQTGLGNPLHRPLIGVFTGSSMNTYLPNVIGGECNLVSGRGTELMLTNDKDYLPARISYKLGFQGPSIAVQTGCSSSLMAVHCAVQSLLLGECEIAFAGGVSVHAHSHPGYIYQSNLMFSPDGTCRPFDEEANGTFFGDGAGLVALRPFETAMECGDSIYAVIVGSATSNDGSMRAGFSAPGVEGQVQAIVQAQAVAGISPESLSMIEAHGTGTRLGDPVEFEALRQAFARRTDRRGFCALGSVKANLGHLAAAAGFAGLAKTVMSLKNSCIPPHPSFKRANPALRLNDSPFFINTQPVMWPSGEPRRAGLSSFGAGGSNVHVIMEEAPKCSARSTLSGWHTVPLSARDSEGLEQLAQALREQLIAEPDMQLSEIAHGFAEGRTEFACRTFVHAKDSADLVEALAAHHYALNHVTCEPGRVLVVVNDLLSRTLAHERFYRKELDLLIRDVRKTHGLMQNAHLSEGTSGNLPDSMMSCLAKLAIFRCLRLLIRMPLVFLIETEDQWIIDCRQGGSNVDDIVKSLLPFEKDVDFCLHDQIVKLPDDKFLDFIDQEQTLRLSLGKLWSEGVPVDWSVLRAGEIVQHRSLPVPVMRYHCCGYTPLIDNAQLTDDVIKPRVYLEQWHRGGRITCGVMPQENKCFYLFGDNDYLVKSLGSELLSVGQSVIYDPPDEKMMPDHLIWCLCDPANEVNIPDFAWKFCDQVKYYASRNGKTFRLTLAGSGFVEPFGEIVTNAGRSAALACISAINQELPGIQVNILDIPVESSCSPPLVSQIVMLLLQPLGSVPVYALRNGQIWHRFFVPLYNPVNTRRPRHPVCLVTGGLGSVGFGMSSYLSRRFNADLILLRRPGAPPPHREALYRHRLQTLREGGGNVEVIQADICDQAQLYAALYKVEQSGIKLDSFVHAAGISGNRTVQWLGRTSPGDWQTLMEPKWTGARLLHEWFSDRFLQFGCFVSSLSVLAGGLGLAPYSAANESCAFWCRYGNDQRPYFAIDWDGWEGWGHDESFRYSADRAPALNQQAVDHVLDAVFASYNQHNRFIISSVELEPRLRAAWGAGSNNSAKFTSATEHAPVEARMAELWSDVLRCHVGEAANFFDLGGDSLVGAELIRRVNAQFAVTLSMLDLFDSASIASMSRLVRQRLASMKI